MAALRRAQAFTLAVCTLLLTPGAAAPPAPLIVSSLPCYVIALNRSSAWRWDALAAEGILWDVWPRAQRYPGIELVAADVMHDPRVSPQGRLALLQKSRRSHTDLGVPGQVGLYLTNIALWETLLKGDDPALVVMEDDAKPTEGLGGELQAAAARLPPVDAFDVWLFGHLEVKASSPLPGYPGLHRITDFFGTAGYVVTRRGAARLAALALPIELQVDAYIATLAALGELEVLAGGRGGSSGAWMPIRSGSGSMQGVSCDVCDLPANYHRLSDVLFWMCVGVAFTLFSIQARARRWGARAAGAVGCGPRWARLEDRFSGWGGAHGEAA